MEIERRLSDVLSEFARTLVTDFPIQAILDHLVVRIVDVLPGQRRGCHVDRAGVGAPLHRGVRRGRHALRASPDRAGRRPVSRRLSNEARRSSFPTSALDDRFPTFAPRALEEGLAAVFTFPLRQDDHQLGALDLYRTSAGPMNSGAMTAAQTLADVAAAYLLNAQARSDLRDSSERARESALHDALDGPAQPDLAGAAPGPRHPPVPTVREAGGGPVRRSRPVQGDQRHLRSPRRRRAPRGGGGAAHRAPAPRRHLGPPGRRRVRRLVRGPRPPVAGRGPRHADRPRPG